MLVEGRMMTTLNARSDFCRLLIARLRYGIEVITSATRTQVPDGPFYVKETLRRSKCPISPAFVVGADHEPGNRNPARDRKIVNQLPLEAKNVWKAAKEERISIYSSNTKNEWRLINSRPKRPLGSIP